MRPAVFVHFLEEYAPSNESTMDMFSEKVMKSSAA